MLGDARLGEKFTEKVLPYLENKQRRNAVFPDKGIEQSSPGGLRSGEQGVLVEVGPVDPPRRQGINGAGADQRLFGDIRGGRAAIRPAEDGKALLRHRYRQEHGIQHLRAGGIESVQFPLELINIGAASEKAFHCGTAEKTLVFFIDVIQTVV